VSGSGLHRDVGTDEGGVIGGWFGPSACFVTNMATAQLVCLDGRWSMNLYTQAVLCTQLTNLAEEISHQQIYIRLFQL
jgi:hypothetical protein